MGWTPARDAAAGHGGSWGKLPRLRQAPNRGAHPGQHVWVVSHEGEAPHQGGGGGILGGKQEVNHGVRHAVLGGVARGRLRGVGVGWGGAVLQLKLNARKARQVRPASGSACSLGALSCPMQPRAAGRGRRRALTSPCSSASAISSRHFCAQKSIRQRGSPPACSDRQAGRQGLRRESRVSAAQHQLVLSWCPSQLCMPAQRDACPSPHGRPPSCPACQRLALMCSRARAAAILSTSRQYRRPLRARHTAVPGRQMGKACVRFRWRGVG